MGKDTQIARQMRKLGDEIAASGLRGFARRLRGLATRLDGGRARKPALPGKLSSGSRKLGRMSLAARGAIDMGMDEIDPSFAQLLRGDL